MVDKHNSQLSARFNAEKELANYKQDESKRISKVTTSKNREIEELRAQSVWQEGIIDRIATLFVKIDRLFRQAIEAIIHYGQFGFGGKFGVSGHQNIFHDEEAHTIKASMENFAGEGGDYHAVGRWYRLYVHKATLLKVRYTGHSVKWTRWRQDAMTGA